MSQAEWEYFNEWSVLSIVFLSGGLGPSRLWTETMPQLALQEPTLRYGAMAVGALRKAALLQDAATVSLHGECRHVGNAIAYYCEALRLQAVATPCREGLRTALLSSLLFICFEAQRGNTACALKHITHGFCMLNELAYCTDRAQGLVSIAPAPPLFVQDVLDCYKPLELQSRSFIDSYSRFFFPRQAKSESQDGAMSHFNAVDGSLLEVKTTSKRPSKPFASRPSCSPCHSSSAAAPSRRMGLVPFSKVTPYFRPKLSSILSLQDMPLVFQHMDEALGYWALVQKNMVQHIPMLAMATSQLALTRVASERELEMKLFSMRKNPLISKFIAESRYWLQRWNAAYLELYQLSTCEPVNSSSHHLKAINLRVEYLILYVYTTMTRFSGISTARALTPQYMEINLLCERLLRAQQHCGFAMDCGWTWPLFVSAFACRDAAVRADAIRILGQYPRRNALRDSRVFRAIALKNEEVEGHVVSEGSEGEQWLRLRRRELIFQDLGSSVDVVYRSSQKSEGSGQWELVEEAADFAVLADGRLAWRRVEVSDSASIMAGVC
ncbi:hypothetical protein CDD81_4714 [Ophiocordyceps australis]|uniref:C6 zinc finger domain protein n=1 Tax=Ophiocordyceps australis TaxID=1399860 RepID=A0A2C5Y6M7_9HYPO|nr:hypothetical protein CDD81_4714 [Ophiocordyceps australis]